jgi:ABC-type Fe3+/spermidine/putrescine transport system ATPase subunit
MIIGDTVLVMNEGRLQQIGSPYEIYKDPKGHFVANFIGISSFIEGVLRDFDRQKGMATIESPLGKPFLVSQADQNQIRLGEEVIVCLRPEAIHVSKNEDPNFPSPPFRGRITQCSFLGTYTDLRVRIGDTVFRCRVSEPVFTVDEEVYLYFDPKLSTIVR